MPLAPPDYSRSIVNLMQTLAARHGVTLSSAVYPPLVLPGDTDSASLLLIIDGLGHEFLRQFPDSFLAQHQRARLSSVFPTTTASAITSFLTAVAPQQHAISGWFTWFRELGCVTTVLPFNPRFRGPSLTEANLTPEQLLGAPSCFADLKVPSHIVYPDYIVDSAYTRATSGKAQRHAYETLSEMFDKLLAISQNAQQQLIFSYWAHFDALAHEKGIDSPEAQALFRILDESCAYYVPRLAENGLNVFISADHGLIDTSPEHTLQIDEHPVLRETLSLPLCGEPRAAFAYVHAHQREVFEDYVHTQLAHACELHVSSHLIEDGYFGLGRPHPELCHRVGDYTLIMKENYVIKDRILTEKPFNQIGVHGGLSEQELEVPLISYPSQAFPLPAIAI